MTTPWERELAEKKRREEEAHVAIPILPDTSRALATRPKTIFFASIAAMVVALFVMLELYSMLQDSLGVSDYRYSRRGYARHPVQALLIFIPFFLFLTALLVRMIFMKKIAEELSRKIARKIKCRPEFEDAVFKTILKTPWSKYRFREFSKGRRHARHLVRVTTKFGESRTLEFTDDLSAVIVGPLSWVDPKNDTVIDRMLEGKDPFNPRV